MALHDSLNPPVTLLYESLVNARIDIRFKKNEEIDSWRVQTIPTYEIQSPDDQPNPGALAHELLHIKLDLHGFWSDWNIYKRWNVQTNQVLSLQFISELNNCLAHLKMLPMFMELGCFSVDEFLLQTPKKYFLERIILQVVGLQVKHATGLFAGDVDMLKQIIVLFTNLILIDKIGTYPSANNLHTQAIKEQLREIQPELLQEYEKLLNGWVNANTLDNFTFMQNLGALLKHLQLGIPNP